MSRQVCYIVVLILGTEVGIGAFMARYKIKQFPKATLAFYGGGIMAGFSKALPKGQSWMELDTYEQKSKFMLDVQSALSRRIRLLWFIILTVIMMLAGIAYTFMGMSALSELEFIKREEK